MIDTLRSDLRYAARALAKNPKFSALVIGTMALGIAATTAVYSVIDGVIVRPLPFPEGDRFAQLLRPRTDGKGGDSPITAGTLAAIRNTASTFDAVEAWVLRRVVLGGADARLVQVARASPGLLSLVGSAPPLAGRTFRRDDPSDLIVIREDLWAQVGDPLTSPIGQRVTLDGRSYQILGVMPRSTRYPRADTQAWVAFDWNPAAPATESDMVSGVARLAPDASLAQGRQELSRLAPGLRDAGILRADFSLDLTALNRFKSDRRRGFSTDPVRSTLYLALGAAAFVLFISCANAANLLLARAVAREREIAVRRALGASLGRIWRQIATEALLLSAAAGVVGAALALGLLRLLTSSLPSGVFSVHNIDVAAQSGRTLLVVITLSLATGVSTALVPTLRASRTAIAAALGAVGQAVHGSRRQLQAGLVVAEISLALVLLSGAGLLMRSAVSLQATAPGFAVEQLVVISPGLPGALYPTPASRVRFLDDLTARVARSPGVLATGRAGCAPPCVGSIYYGVMHVDETDATTAASPVFAAVVSQTYFAAMGIPLRAGRTFATDDDTPDATAVIVSETTARTWWPGDSPIGRRVRQDYEGAPWRTVVGVVGDIRQINPDLPAGLQVYHPFPADGQQTGEIVVRAAAPGAIISTLRGETRSLDAAVFPGISTMTDRAREVLNRSWFRVWLMTVLAGLGLVLAAGGVFATVAYDVTRRTGELGVRMALGAAPSDVTRLVLRHGFRLTANGVALGLAGSLALSRLARSMLFGVEPTDPVSLAFATAVLVTTSLLATYLPTRRATRIAPVEALRAG